MNTIQVIKIGGNIIDNDTSLNSFLDLFSQIKGPRILVHGGGRKASHLSQKLGIEPVMVEGRRITDAAALEIVTMVYGGLINKNIVARLQSRKTDALGVSGADLNLVPAWKRKASGVDYGHVGDFDPEKINAKRLEWLIENDIIPVMCALTHDGRGSLLNTNADSLAAGIAIALALNHPTELHLCFEKSGVLKNMHDENSVIGELRKNDFILMKEEGSVYEGMIPKLENAFLAAGKGVSVTIRHALYPETGTKLISDDRF